MDVVGTFKIKIVTIWNLGVSKTNEHIKIQIKIPNPSQEPPAYSKALNQDLKDMNILRTFKSRLRVKIQIMDISKSSDRIQLKIKMPNPSQEPAASSKATNEDLNGMDVLCTFKIKI